MEPCVVMPAPEQSEESESESEMVEEEEEEGEGELDSTIHQPPPEKDLADMLNETDLLNDTDLKDTSLHEAETVDTGC